MEAAWSVGGNKFIYDLLKQSVTVLLSLETGKVVDGVSWTRVQVHVSHVFLHEI